LRALLFEKATARPIFQNDSLIGDGTMDVQKIMVVGAGQMGSGIAQVCAMAGYEVFLQDVKQEYVDR
jgi:hypothetical protein